MELKTSTDPKIVKMFRRLEKFLDQEGLATLGRSVDFMNAETGRVFAVFLSPDSRRELTKERDALLDQLTAANVTLEILEDDNALLALIDAQNDVLMGRTAWDEAAKVADTVDWKFTGNDVVGNAFDFPPAEKCGTFHVEGLDYTEADASPDEDYPEIMIPRREYEELLNLRVKRARDKETITGLNATVRENKRGAETLSRQRDSYLAQLLEAKQALRDAQEWAFIGGIRGVGFPDLEEFHAFTSDTIRD